jgi:hypothetical protein
MRRLKQMVIGALAAVLPVMARGQEPSRDQLLAELETLRQRVDQLESRQSNDVNAQVQRTVERVLSDANHRSQFLAQNAGLTAGFDQGRFFIRSEDGNYLLMPGFVFQARHTINYNSENGGDTQSGMEIRRMKLIFEGNAITPDLQYKFQWETRSTDGSPFLQDAWVRYKLNDNWRLEAGQFKDGIHHEEAMPDQNQLSADRSWVNSLLGGGNIDRVQGVMLMFDDRAHWRVNLVAHDGANTKNTTFADSGGGSSFLGLLDPNFGFSARVEYTVKGSAKQYDDFSAMGNTQDLLVFGGGVHYSQGGDTTAVLHTLDAQWENSEGLGLYGAFYGVWRDAKFPSPVVDPTGTFYDYGALVQAGYMVGKKTEVFGRYEFMELDGDLLLPGAEDFFHAFTVGANYFMNGHRARFTIDGGWLPNGSVVGSSGVGVVQGFDDQFFLRFQAQLVL